MDKTSNSIVNKITVFLLNDFKNNYKKHITAIIAFIALLITDIITKYIVDTNIEEGERIPLLGQHFQLVKFYNEGGVFGIMQGHKTFFLIISIIVFMLLLLFYIHEKHKSHLFSLSMGMIFSGAIGNILDRLMDKPGVVDFIYIGIRDGLMWPAFNVADMAIVTGAFLLGYVFYMQEREAIKTKELQQTNSIEKTEEKIENEYNE
jgi:signal peptidase II